MCWTELWKVTKEQWDRLNNQSYVVHAWCSGCWDHHTTVGPLPKVRPMVRSDHANCMADHPQIMGVILRLVKGAHYYES